MRGESSYTPVPNRGMITISIMLANIMQGLDNTILNVALPHIQGSLSASQDQIAWALTSYIVCAAIMMPLTGWLAGRFGIKYIFLASVIGFTLASALCGMAANLNELVIFRALQGLAGAGLIPLSQATLLQINPPDRHGHAIDLAGIADRNLKRLAYFQLLRAHEIDHGQHVLDRFREIQRGDSRRLVLIRIALSPSDFPLFVVENRVANAHAFALFVELVGSHNHELIRLDNRFDMLVKMNSGKPGKKTLTDDVGDQAQGIAGGGSLRARAKAELADVRAAQQRLVELCFIKKLFASGERKSVRRGLLRTRESAVCGQQQ